MPQELLRELQFSLTIDIHQNTLIEHTLILMQMYLYTDPS